MPGSTSKGITYPTPADLIKSGASQAKLAADIQSTAVSADAAISLEGSRAEEAAISAAEEYTGAYGVELAADLRANDYVRGRATTAQAGDSAWRHATEEGDLLPLGYRADGHLDTHAKLIWKQDIVHTTEVGAHPDYAHIIATPDDDLLMGFRWDGGIDAPGLEGAAAGTVLDIDMPAGGTIPPAVSSNLRWLAIGSSTTQASDPEYRALATTVGASLTNMGKGGERIQHIEARWGSNPARLTVAGGVIPASGAVTVTADNMPANAMLEPFIGTLLGIRGTLSSTATVLTFTRSAAGAAVPAATAEPFLPEKPAPYLADLFINDSGKNNVLDAGGAALVIAGTRRMIKHLTPQIKKFVVFDHFANTNYPPTGLGATQIAEINNSYYKEYGVAVIRRRDYLASAKVWADTGIVPTAADLQAQTDRLLPPSLSNDPAHMNAAARQAVTTHLLLPKLQELGWRPEPVQRYTIDQSAGRVVKVWDYLNNREQLIYGDTGDRDISSNLSKSTGKVVVSRMGNNVTLDLMGVAPTSELASGTVFLNIPSGFRSPIRKDLPLLANITGNASRSSFIFANGGMGVWNPSTSDLYRFTVSYRTNDPWPTSLPGVAA